MHLSSIAKKGIKNVIENQAQVIISILASSFVILLYGSFRLTSIFKASLDEVKKAFKENHSGHFQKIKLSNRSDEFDSIVEEFNLMNHKLSETTVSLAEMKKAVEKRTQVLEQLSNTDPLTKVANRRALYERGHFELSRVLRTHNQLTVTLLDCDYFKNVNDQFGHQVGDELLKHICKICDQEIRDIDFLARYGGEEFVIILPNCDMKGGVEIANRIQESLAQNMLTVEGKNIHMTLSIGVCMLNDEYTNFEKLLNGADKAMYQAKNNGRNRIETTDD